jgi:hypothetical protein
MSAIFPTNNHGGDIEIKKEMMTTANLVHDNTFHLLFQEGGPSENTYTTAEAEQLVATTRDKLDERITVTDAETEIMDTMEDLFVYML